MSLAHLEDTTDRNVDEISNAASLSEKTDIAMQVVEHEPTLSVVPQTEWDDCTSLFSDIIPEQTGIFNVSHWGTRNIECVCIRLGDKIIGGAVLIVRQIPFSTTGLAVLKWGPVCNTEQGDDYETRYELVVKALIREYCKKRNYHLTIMPVANPDSVELAPQVLSSMGFSTGNTLAAPERYIVNTDQTSEELRSSLNQKWRYNLRKAHKNEFRIEFASTVEGLEVFLALYAKMMARKQFHDSSAIDALRNIFDNGNVSTKPVIVLVYHDGEVTAGGVFSFYGDMTSYMFGATDDRALGLKAGYAMHWWVAEHLCNQSQSHWYDLGGNDLDAGLHQFKKGFIGKTGHILQSPPRFHIATSFIAKLAGSIIFKLRDSKAAATRFVCRMRQKAGQ